MTDETEVDFSMVDKFPKSARTRNRPSSTSTSSNSLRRKAPIPVGKRASRLQKEELLVDGCFSIRSVTLYSYDCPSDDCEFNTSWSLNGDAAYKTLQSHIVWEHRRERTN